MDARAPLVFINGADTKAAQMFTLGHELAHVWLGAPALSDASAASVPEQAVESWCNRVAAELLAPLEAVRAELVRGEPLERTVARLARRFKVSTLVVLRRLRDTGHLGRQAFEHAYDEELARLRGIAKRAGGDFYLTTTARVSKRFARARSSGARWRAGRSIATPSACSASRKSRRSTNSAAACISRSDPVQIRPARKADAAAISACVEAAYRHYIPRIGRRPGPMLDDYAEVIRERQVAVAELDGEIAGVLVLSVRDGGFLLDNVAVAPSHHGKGVGRALLERAETEARRQGVSSIYLYTHEKMTENRALYAKIGYVEYDRRLENALARVYMRKQLR